MKHENIFVTLVQALLHNLALENPTRKNLRVSAKSLNAMNKDRKDQNNAFLLVMISFIASFLVGVAYIIITKIFLSSTDLSYNQNLIEVFTDPFIYTIAGTYIIISGIVYLPLVFYCLRRKNLRAASIVILGAIFFWIIVAVPFSMIVGLIGIYLISILALLFCKFARIKVLEIRES